eukprot:scaffold86722_cov46-Phaeocystis_antarctica.AAC.1
MKLGEERQVRLETGLGSVRVRVRVRVRVGVGVGVRVGVEVRVRVRVLERGVERTERCHYYLVIIPGAEGYLLCH